jgi:hypothetical protein
MRLGLVLLLFSGVACSRSGLPVDSAPDGGGGTADLARAADLAGTADLAPAAACTTDVACGAGAYCRGLLHVCVRLCQFTAGTAVDSGSCHRDCSADRCRCDDAADCPGAFASCDPVEHRCVVESPPICHAPSCPMQCTAGQLAQYGDVCTCPLCPE